MGASPFRSPEWDRKGRGPVSTSSMRAGLVGLAIALITLLGAAAPGPTAGASTAFRVERDVAWRTVDGEVLTLDAYVPQGRTRARAAVVLVHGGAWQGGDKQDFAAQGEALAAIGYVAVSVNYRLAPEHPFPAAIDDVRAAVAWLRSPAQVRHFGIDARRIGALGGSAGGHLVAMLGTLGTGRLDTGSRVAAVVTWSALTDLNAIPVPGFGIELYGCASSACPDVAAAASPVNHVDPSDAPMLVVNATDDPITHVDQATEMVGRLADARVDHALLLLPGSGHSTELAPGAWTATVDYLRQHLAATAGVR
jgi:acetyl esterase/lipase